MGNAKIMIVEDEKIVAMEIQSRLESFGYTVTALASSGEEALKKVEENFPDLVLMDIVLKGDIDGIETAEKIRARFDIPIVFLTAYADEHTLQRAKITAPFGYILKPFEERELYTNIEIALCRYRMSQKMKESEHWLTATLKSIGDAVIATDNDGKLKLMNPFAEVLTGWKLEDALDQPLNTVFRIVNEDTGEPTEDPTVKVIREGAFYGLANKTALITKTGNQIPIEIIGSPIKNDKDQTIGVVMVFYDIIERKRIEDELKKSAQDAEHKIIAGKKTIAKILMLFRKKITSDSFIKNC